MQNSDQNYVYFIPKDRQPQTCDLIFREIENELKNLVHKKPYNNRCVKAHIKEKKILHFQQTASVDGKKKFRIQ